VNAAGVLLRKLESIAELSRDEQNAVLSLPISERTIARDCDIVREGDKPAESFVVAEGFICRYKDLPDGRRQIFSFHTPGDIPDLQTLHLRVMDHNIATIVDSTVGFIAHEPLRALCESFPRVASALWRDTLIDSSIFREWMVGLGRRDARQRVAHLLCEMARRFSAVGLLRDNSYTLPLTQQEIGDALGLSTVHVNRVLQELRRDGLVDMRSAIVTIRDWEGLKQAGEFDPLYLHLEQDGNA
jgi:CRP-like cAMP-binding protein